MFIDDERKWRISKSGYSIRTGWADDKRIIAKFGGNVSDMNEFRVWLKNAETICDLYNASLPSRQASESQGA